MATATDSTIAVCRWCGTQFVPSRSSVRGRVRTQCSLTCDKAIAAKANGDRYRQRRLSAITQPKDHKLLPVGKGLTAQVDTSLFTQAAQYSWHVRSDGYVYSAKAGYLHRFVLREAGRLLDGRLDVDHVNRNPLDNRSANLRAATRSQNLMNRLNARKFVGVHKKSNKWQARIMVERQTICVGSFSNELEAAWMRDQWAIALHRDFACLNFEYVEATT
ncbi:HNH endonuclease [Gordonia sp. CNJ-863]|uniref:HNH endonuclease n=1 Tax=Gordonia sp. CNJ-863 TaxID=1904963 RepID=UPI00269D32AD